MVNYKQGLMFILCVASMNSMNGMENKKGSAKAVVEEDAFVQKRINELLSVETDSVVIQRGRTILSNEDYNDNPSLLAAYGHFFAEFYIYTVGEGRYYNMLIERAALEMREDVDYVSEYMNATQDETWKKEKKEILKTDDVKQVKNGIYRDLGSSNDSKDKDTKMTISAYKEWMKTRDFVSTRFLIETICKLMGERNLVEQETDKVITLLKHYDNK